MSLPALQDDSNVPSSKKMGNGIPYWLNHILVHVEGASDGTANGKWSYDTSASHKIKYNSTLDKWEDLADGQPSKISDTYNVNTTAVAGSSTGANPAEVFLWNSNGGTFLGKFANPFYTAPSSGGGTGTEGNSTPSGTVVKIGTSANAATVKFTIDSSSPSSSGLISYQIIRDGAVYYTITGHTAGTPTETTVGWYNSSWELRMVSTSGLYETQTLDFILKEVNVSQNFW